MINLAASSGHTEFLENGNWALSGKIELYKSMQQIGLTLTIGTAALLWTAEQIRNLPPDPNPEDSVSEYARSVAEDLLTDCTKETPCSIAPASIEQFEHDLLLRWQHNDKGLILTCPASDERAASLYREEIVDGRAKNPQLLSSASSKDLAFAMNWMMKA